MKISNSLCSLYTLHKMLQISCLVCPIYFYIHSKRNIFINENLHKWISNISIYPSFVELYIARKKKKIPKNLSSFQSLNILSSLNNLRNCTRIFSRDALSRAFILEQSKGRGGGEKRERKTREHRVNYSMVN